MYKVLCDTTKIYDSRIEELALINPIVELEENCAGSFSFTISPDHPYYDLILKRKSVIQVYQDTELIFSGMAIETEVDFYKQKYVYCEGELSYLNDSIQRPARYQSITVRGLLEAYINNHNAQVETEKQFTVGMVTVTDPNDSIYCFSNMESTMKCLKEDLCDDLGGYFRIRHADGVKYIDYLADSMNICTQVIRLGENLIDFKSNIDSTDIATAIIPLGARLEESPVAGLEVRLDIKSVNDGLDYVCDQDAISNYGWIYKTVEWDDVTTASRLKTKGQQYLADIQFENIVIEAQAVDLHFVDSTEERFRLSDQIRVISTPHGLNRLFRLTKQTINLNNPENDTITLGKEERLSLSTKTNQVNEAIYKAIESIVPPSTILEHARDNATQLITNAMGGYVYKTNNELFIMDAEDPDDAEKVWRWNINGLGYSSTGIDGNYGLAMTMDGSIVADFITSGTIASDRIKSTVISAINGQNLKIDAKNLNINGAVTFTDLNADTQGRINTAQSTANSAVTTANGAVTTANSASSNASSALSIANSASSTANSALLEAAKIGELEDSLAAGTTVIDGGCIKTNSIYASQLAFVPVETTSIIASINASTEGLRIAANKINIHGSVNFSDLDINTQNIIDNASTDASDALSDASYALSTANDASDSVSSLESGLSSGTTTINGGCITTGTINAINITGCTITSQGNSLIGEDPIVTIDDGKISFTTSNQISGRTSEIFAYDENGYSGITLRSYRLALGDTYDSSQLFVKVYSEGREYSAYNGSIENSLGTTFPVRGGLICWPN